MKILNVYASLNGQTEKVALAVTQAAQDAGCTVTTLNIRTDNAEIDPLEYDLVFMGSGVYSWLPGKAMLKWMDAQMEAAKKAGRILPNSPRIPGKFAALYCTYAGPHTGEAEAVPAVKYMGQLFDHLGMTIAAEWCVPGAFVPKNMQFMNTQGRMGNIEDRPNSDDLAGVRGRVAALIDSLLPVVKAIAA